MKEPLRAPFPYFGGKRRVAALVWSRIGDVDNYIEPFCGSAAVLLARPHPPRVETLNDADCYLANFWRATAQGPEAVAAHCDWPVSECDLHARHHWLVRSEEAAAFRQRMRECPDYYDPKIAGWWCWGLCCWIGGGWCKADQLERHEGALPEMVTAGGIHGASKLRIAAHNRGSVGKGVHAQGPTEGLSQQVPAIGDVGRGALASGRPQLADAYARGRGVHGNDAAGTCEQRRRWLVEWFSQLRDRLRMVRVCCGDWRRVCDSDSVTVRLGTTGIFFDPPYSAEADREMNLYAVESADVAHAVRAYCRERGSDPRYRIALCGYEGEGHEELEALGWEVVAWKAAGGYGNRSEKGQRNAGRERIWFSPGCRRERTLFSEF